MSQDEAAECPLCMEPLELDDLSFYPCTCGYQICRFCWHRLRTDENGLCPACRKQYSEDPANFKPLSVDEMQQKAKNERKAKKQRLVENRKHLANVRVVQKNLVFVVGLPTRLACQEQLKRHECFGKFGKIHKVVVNQSTSYAGVQGPSASAYVTYFRSEDALRAIEAVNNVRVDGKTLKASLGTTKYCNHFLKGGQCPKSDCMYLHELGDEAASFTKEQMQAGKHTEYERRLHEQLNHTGGCGNNGSTNQRGGPKEGEMAPQHQQHKFSQKENSSNNKMSGQSSSPLPVSERIPGSHPSSLSPPPSAAGTQANNNKQQQLSGAAKCGGSDGVCDGVAANNGGHRTRHKSSECSSEEASSCEEQLQQHHHHHHHHPNKSPATPLSERSDSPDLERLVGRAADETPDDDDEDDGDDDEEEEEEDDEDDEDEDEDEEVDVDHEDEDGEAEDEDVSDVNKQHKDSRTSVSAAMAATTGCNQARMRYGHEMNHRQTHQQQQLNQRPTGTSKQSKHLQQQQQYHQQQQQQQQQQQHMPVTTGRPAQHLRSPSPPRHQAQQQNCSPPKQYQLHNECSLSRQGIPPREDRRSNHLHHQQQHLCDTPPSPDSSGDGVLRNSGKGVMQQLQSLNQLSLGRQVHPSNHAVVQDHLLQQQQGQHRHHQHSNPHQQSLGIQQQQHHIFQQQQQQHHHLQRSSSREQLSMAASSNQQSSLVNEIELDFDPIYISRKGLADLIEREQHHPLGGSPLTHPHLMGSSSGPNPNNPSGNPLANLLPFGRIPPSRPSPPGIAPLSVPSGHLPGGGHHISNQATAGAFPPGLAGPMGPIPGLGAPPNQLGAQMVPPPDHPSSHGSPHQGMRRAPPPGFGPPMPPPPQQSSGPFGPFGQGPPPMGPGVGHPHSSGGMTGFYAAAASTNNDMTPPGSSSSNSCFGYRGYGGGQPGVVIPGGVASGGHCDDLLNMKEQQEQLRQLLPSVNISFGPPPHHTPPSTCGSSLVTSNNTNSTSLAPPPGMMGALTQPHSQRQQPPMNMLTHHSGVHAGLPGGNSLHHSGGGHHGPSGWPETFQDPAILSSSRHIAQPPATTTGPADQRPSPYF